MLSRLVRIQLVIFALVSVIGIAAMVVVYVQVPTLLGLGRYTVTMQMPAAGGLYRFANVTFRGVQIGKVIDLSLTRNGPEATLRLDRSPQIPSDLTAEVRSMSAVGEQYVDLRPRHDGGPYLGDGSVISAQNVTIPQQVGPMLDQVSALMTSIPRGKVGDLLDETAKGLSGAGFDLGSLYDSTAIISGDLNSVSDQTRALVDDGAPLLDGQAQTVDDTRQWAHSLAGITDQVATRDQQVRAILQTGPGAADEASKLLAAIKPTLPVLLANLSTLGQVLLTYRPSLQQLFVLFPPYVAATQSFALPENNPTGLPLGDFTTSIGDPPACTVGFLPPSQWRSPADTTVTDTPDGLYCKLPQDSPIGVRGARNNPCMGHPGKRAPTVQICNSDKPYEPLAMRQHATGPYPFDPNLTAQGVPPDDRVTFGDHIFGPLDGTPRPDPPPPAEPAPVPGETPAAAPSSFDSGRSHQPAVAVAEYDPHTGRYIGPDGHLARQTNLTGRPARSWKDLLPT